MTLSNVLKKKKPPSLIIVTGIVDNRQEGGSRAPTHPSFNRCNGRATDGGDVSAMAFEEHGRPLERNGPWREGATTAIRAVLTPYPS